MKRTLTILTTIFFSTCLAMGAKELTVSCGDRVEIKATPFEGYHFVRWEDVSGNIVSTKSVDKINVDSTITLTAFFASNCEYNIRICKYYDWLLMLDVRQVRDTMDYVFAENDVEWYRVKGGEPDDPNEEQFPQDDELVCSGYYLTIDRNLWTTGDYYAVVKVASSPTGLLCQGYLRSEIAHFLGTQHNQRLAITPSHIGPGQQMKIIGLDPTVSTTIRVYDMIGRLLLNQVTKDQTTYYLQAANTPGCYNVVVSWGDQEQVLRYLVNNH